VGYPKGPMPKEYSELIRYAIQREDTRMRAGSRQGSDGGVTSLPGLPPRNKLGRVQLSLVFNGLALIGLLVCVALFLGLMARYDQTRQRTEKVALPQTVRSHAQVNNRTQPDRNLGPQSASRARRAGSGFNLPPTADGSSAKTPRRAPVVLGKELDAPPNPTLPPPEPPGRAADGTPLQAI